LFEKEIKECWFHLVTRKTLYVFYPHAKRTNMVEKGVSFHQIKDLESDTVFIGYMEY
jgi:hypothetical protein